MSTTAATLPDLLAAIEHGLRITPEDSLVAVSVRPDGRLGVHVRLDAAPSLGDPAQAARWAIGHVRTDTKLERIIAAVYTDAPAEDAERLLRALAKEADGLGLAVYTAFHVDAEAWHELRRGATGPREQIKDSVIYAEMVYHGSAVLGREPDDAPFTGPDDAAERIAATAPHAPDAGAAWWTELLDSRREPTEAETWQALADLCEGGNTRDLMIAATAGDPIPDADHATAAEHLRQLLLGQTTTRPDWERIDQAEHVLAGLLGHAPQGHRAGALTILGWIAWYKGSGSAAHVWFTRAERDTPGYRLANLLAELVSGKFLPAVCKNPATAYRRG